MKKLRKYWSLLLLMTCFLLTGKLEVEAEQTDYKLVLKNVNGASCQIMKSDERTDGDGDGEADDMVILNKVFTSDEETIICKNTSYIYTSDVKKEGYRFLGWTVNGGTELQSFILIQRNMTEDMVYTAHWMEDNFQITFRGFKGADNIGSITAGLSYPQSIEVDVVTTKWKNTWEHLLPNLEKPGYTFLGWTGDNGDVPQKNLIIPAGTTGDKEYTANWEPTLYNIVLDLQGGTLDTTGYDATWSIEKSVCLPKDKPKKDGAVFLGWKLTNPLPNTTTKYSEYRDLHYQATWATDGPYMKPFPSYDYVSNGGKSETLYGAYRKNKDAVIQYKPRIGYKYLDSYNGEEKFKEFKEGVDYDLTYSNLRKLDSVATGTVKFKGEYSHFKDFTFKFDVRLQKSYGTKLDGVGAFAFDIHKTSNGYEATASGPSFSFEIGNVVIPASINVQGVEVPVTKIDCSNVKDAWSLTIPSTIKEVDAELLNKCDKVILKGDTKINGKVNKDVKVTYENGKKQDKEESKTATFKKNQKFVVKNLSYKITNVSKKEVSLVGTKYSKSSNKLSKLTVPKTVTYKKTKFKVTSIGNKAFKGYNKIKTVTISDNIKTVGKEAFSGCKKLTTVKFGKNTKTIDQKAFYNCKSLKAINLKANKSLKTIKQNAFKNINKKAKFGVISENYEKVKKLLKSKTGFKKSMKVVK